jgi:Fe-S cluster biogenesis protein NfuA
VADPGKFQEQIRRLSELVTEFEHLPDSPQKSAGRQLIQLLMEVHAEGLERVMEVVFESREGGNPLITQLGNDQVTGALLLLYSLHPDSLDTRINTAVERLQPRLRKMACAIDEVYVDQGAVRLRVTAAGHGCGSSAGELKALVETGIYELAPDVASLEIVGLEEKSATGFVALESLVGQAHGQQHHAGQAK